MKKIFIHLFVVLFLLCSESSGGDKTSPGKLNPEKYCLDNGFTVILLEDHNAPVMTVRCLVNAGSITEGEYSGAGISHFVEHMLFKGTKKRAVGQIGREVKEIGGRTNAYTSFEQTVYHITASSAHPEKMLDIMSDAIFNSSFDPGEVKKEREVILKEINLYKDDPGRYISRLAWDTMFNVHPYGLPVIGYEEVFKKITRGDLLDYYHRMYVPDNMILVVVGDFVTEDVKGWVGDYFGGYGRKTIQPVSPPREPSQVSYREITEEYDVNTSYLFMGYHGPDLYSKDLYAMDVLAVILGRGATSRLYRDLREKKKLVYSVKCWSYTPRNPGVFGINVNLDEENINLVKQEIISHIDRLKVKSVNRKELERAKIKITNDNVYSRQTVEGLAGKLGSDELYTHSLDFSENYVKKAQEVTAGDIKKVVRKYFYDDNLTVVMLVPEKAQKKAGVEEESRKPPEIKKLELENGMKLLLREDHRLPVVSIRAAFLGGLRVEDENDSGICSLMRSVMLKGTGKRNADKIASVMESMGASIGSFTGNNSFGFTCAMISHDLETGLEVLSDVILNPSFPEKEINKERDNVLNSIRSYGDNVLNAAKKLFRKTMFKDHPYGFLDMGEEDSVKSLTRKDLVNLYNELVLPENLVLAVYGDINPDEVEDMVKKYFKFRGAEEKKVNIKERKAEFPEDIRKAFKEMDKRQTVLFVGFKGVDIYSPDRCAFEVLGAVLNSMGGRLFESLRGKQGLAYMVGTFNRIGVDPGAFVFYIVTEKDKKEKALKGIFNEIAKLKTKLIKEEELKRAKAELIGKHSIGIQTNDSLAFKTALDELYGLGYGHYLNYTDTINSITREDIRKIAAEYFNLSKYALIEVGN